MKTTYFILLILLISLSCERDKTPIHNLGSPITAGFWQRTSGPYGGWVKDMEVNANDYMFAATDYRGLFRSVDNGKSWQYLGFHSHGIKTLDIDESGRIYVVAPYLYGSGDNGLNWKKLTPDSLGWDIEYMSSNDSLVIVKASNGQLYISRNNGATWTKASIFDGFQNITFIRLNSSAHFFVATGNALYRSTDNGSNWEELLTNPQIDIFKISQQDGLFLYSSSTSKLYRSKDNGENWDELEANFGEIRSLKFTPSANLYAIAVGSEHVWFSTDNGNSWSSIETPVDHLLSVSMDSQDRIFIGARDIGVMKTEDGSSWQHIGLPVTNVRSLFITKDNRIFAAFDDGISLSTDSGASWNNVLFQKSMFAFSIVVHQNDNLFAGTANGIYGSADNGQSWQELFGTTNQFTEIAVDSKGNVFAAILWDGLLVSKDNGITWQDLSPPSSVSQIAIDSKDRLYCGRPWIVYDFHSMYISTDIGATWRTATVDSSSAYFELNDIMIDRSGSALLATSDGIYRYDESKNVVRRFGFNGHVTCITQHPNGMLFIGTMREGIHVSMDGGKTWYLLSNELIGDDFMINAMAFDSGGYLYAAVKDRGVFKSKMSATSLMPY